MTPNNQDRPIRRVGRLVAIAAIGLAAAIPAAAQLNIDDWAEQAGRDIVWKQTQLSDTVYLLLPEPGLAGNLAVSAGEDGILIVDDAMIPVAPKIKAAVEKIQKGRIDFVVNSHGDQFPNLGGYPYIDRDVGGSALGLRDNMAQLLEIVDDETKIIPGHGPLATKADLQKYHDYVAETIDYIEGQKSAGKSLEEVQEAGLPEKYAPYGNGPLSPAPVWIGYVWASLDD